jgi:hypothetical protein
MPFTFARWLDPMIQAPAVQQTVIAAMLTVGFVKPEKDASEGGMWDAMKDLKLITWRHQARDMIFLRRFALRGDSKNRLGVLWIGAQLNGQDYRITCNLLEGPERERLARQLAFANMALGTSAWGGDAYAFKARSIRESNWAGRAPAAVAQDEDAQNDAPPSGIGGHYGAMTFAPSNGELYFNEAVEDEAEEGVYFN